MASIVIAIITGFLMLILGIGGIDPKIIFFITQTNSFILTFIACKVFVFKQKTELYIILTVISSLMLSVLFVWASCVASDMLHALLEGRFEALWVAIILMIPKFIVSYVNNYVVFEVLQKILEKHFGKTPAH